MSVARYPVANDREELPGFVTRQLLPVLRYIDYPLLMMVLGCAALGLWNLAGAVHQSPDLAYAISRQLFFFWIALAIFVCACVVDYRWINRAALFIYAANIAALIIVLFIGSRINGAKSWINLGPVNFQPSETMKVATVLVCARWMALRPERISGWSGLFVPGVICGFPVMLILLQPDLGTALLFFYMFMVMTLMAGAPWGKLAAIASAAFIGFAGAVPFMKPYQKARLLTFLDPEADPMGAGYNVIQSKIATGAGQIFGNGWGNGTQSVHRFLPEHHTDFIFPSLVEQFGLLGGLFTLGLFGLLLLRMVRVMECARDRFGGLVVAGLIAIFSGHILLNIGMTIGLLPVTGVPLPFFSYGGSFLLTTFLLFGLVINVATRRFTFVGR